MKKLLFLCTGNSARSIMAEAIVRHDRGNQADDAWEVESAGVSPKGVHPFSIKVLEEIGVSTAGLTSKNVSTLLAREFDLVVTLCDQAAESCPFFPGAKRMVHLAFDDPAAAKGSDDQIIAEFRRVRDDIRTKLLDLLDGFIKEDKNSR